MMTEQIRDIILQIWNDGAEGIIYEDGDLKDLEERIREALANETVFHLFNVHGSWFVP